MIALELSEIQEKRLRHIRAHVEAEDQVPGLVRNVSEGRGNIAMSADMLAGILEARGMLAWFASRDLEQLRQCFYGAALLQRRCWVMIPDEITAAPKVLGLLRPLVSNAPELISWFAEGEMGFDASRISNPKTKDFWAYCVYLALRGDWDKLRERCKAVFEFKNSKYPKMYWADYQFLGALPDAGLSDLADLIDDVAADNSSGRLNQESGFTEDMISTPAVVYGKIAWLHGFEVAPKSSLAPQAWLDMRPLATYESPFNMRGL